MLVNEDCFTVTSKKQFDFCFTDPPYNIGDVSTGNIKIKGRTDLNNDIAEWDTRLEPTKVSQFLQKHLKPEGNMAIFCAYHQFPEYWAYLDKQFDTFTPFYVCKTNPSPSIRKNSWRQATEIICYAYNKKHYWNFQNQNDMLNWKSFPICMGNERLKNPEGKTLHPTQKRLDICEFHIRVACPQGGTVFDPFAGVGSIGIAALKCGCKYVGIEKDETYFKAAVKRFQEYDAITGRQ